ncbi:MAG: hypothetical protein WCV84_04090 [Patescibacteria group bacterium]
MDMLGWLIGLCAFVTACGCVPEGADVPPQTRTIGRASSAQVYACTIVSGPTQQPSALGVCRMHHPRRPTDSDVAGWFQVVADRPGATVTIVSATLYGVRADGTLASIAGTNHNGQGVAWAGLYQRMPWFGTDAHRPVSVGNGSIFRAQVPTDHVLHGGVRHGNLAGFEDAVFVVEATMTGDARMQLGVDYRPQEGAILPNGNPDVNERSLSDWFTTNSGLCARSTPIATRPNDCTPRFPEL